MRGEAGRSCDRQLKCELGSIMTMFGFLALLTNRWYSWLVKTVYNPRDKWNLPKFVRETGSRPLLFYPHYGMAKILQNTNLLCWNTVSSISMRYTSTTLHVSQGLILEKILTAHISPVHLEKSLPLHFPEDFQSRCQHPIESPFWKEEMSYWCARSLSKTSLSDITGSVHLSVQNNMAKWQLFERACLAGSKF